MLVREKGDPLVRRPPIRMGIGVLLFNIPYYLIGWIQPMENRYLFLRLRLGMRLREMWFRDKQLREKRNLLVQMGMRLLYRIVPPEQT